MSTVVIDLPHQPHLPILTLFIVLIVVICSACAWRGPEAYIRADQSAVPTEAIVTCILDVLEQHDFQVRSVHSDGGVITTRWFYFKDLPVRLEYRDFTLLPDTSGRIKLRVMIRDGGKEIASQARLQVRGFIVDDFTNDTGEYLTNRSISVLPCLVDDIEDILVAIAKRLNYEPRIDWRGLVLPKQSSEYLSSDPINLTNYCSADIQPSWSPDGSKIAFCSDRHGNKDIYIMNVDGSNETRLTSNSANDYLPVWSTDGTKIAFVSDRTGNWDIYVMNTKGTNPGKPANNAPNFK